MKKLFVLVIFSSHVLAINKTDGLDSSVQKGLSQGEKYLKYTVWAAAVLGILAIAFMLFGNIQEHVLKVVARVFAVLGVAAMAFVIPGWFNLTINQLVVLKHF